VSRPDTDPAAAGDVIPIPLEVLQEALENLKPLLRSARNRPNRYLLSRPFPTAFPVVTFFGRDDHT